MIPGGRGPEYLRLYPAVITVVRHFFETNKPVTAVVVDLFGRVVRSEETSDSKINFEIPNLANGIYFVKIKTHDKLQVITVSKQ